MAGLSSLLEDLPSEFLTFNPETSRARQREKQDSHGSGRNLPKDTAQKQRRNKYITRACQDCQRRKVKCSGEDVCLHCRARDVPCIYLTRPANDGRRRRRQAADHQPSSSNREANEAAVQMERMRSASKDNGTMSLHEKISQLQEQLKQVSDRNLERNVNRRPRFTFPSAAPSSVDLSQELGEDTDIFHLNSAGSKSVSLSSQLVGLRELLRLNAGEPPPPPPQPPISDRIYPLELPRPSRLRHLLDVYFRDVDSFFPYLDQKDTETRIFSALDSLGYSEFDLIIDVDVSQHFVVALLCNMLVMGECMDPEDKNPEDFRPGWPMYVRGRKLLQHCSSLKTADLDLVRYHILSSLYMMHLGLLQSTSHAISITVQLAMVARLNDQAAWGNCPPAEIVSRQRLWWTIYFLDRRVAQRNGTPYLIRDTDVAVEEFRPRTTILRPELELSSIQSSGDQVSSPSSNLSYLQALVNFSKLWGQIWDTFFAASASKCGDWREVEITDTRILLVRRELPSELTWNTDMVATYMANRETEPQIRRRLAIFIRINLLRMIIRQNPLSSSGCDEESRNFCGIIACHSIEAIAAFASVCPSIRPSGYFISTALVECICHLVYILQDSTLQTDRAGAVKSFRCAYQLLVEFAKTLNSAKHAVQALTAAIFLGGGAAGPFESSTPEDRMDMSPRDNGLDSQNDHSPSSRTSRLNQVAEQLTGSHSNQRSIAAPTPITNNPSQRISLGESSTQIDLHQEFQQQQIRYAGDSGFIQDLADSYGDLDFDYSQILFSKV